MVFCYAASLWRNCQKVYLATSSLRRLQPVTHILCMLQCPWPTTVVPVQISKTKTKLSVNDFGKGNQVNVHNVVLGKCCGIYLFCGDWWWQAVTLVDYSFWRCITKAKLWYPRDWQCRALLRTALEVSVACAYHPGPLSQLCVVSSDDALLFLVAILCPTWSIC